MSTSSNFTSIYPPSFFASNLPATRLDLSIPPPPETGTKDDLQARVADYKKATDQKFRTKYNWVIAPKLAQHADAGWQTMTIQVGTTDKNPSGFFDEFVLWAERE